FGHAQSLDPGLRRGDGEKAGDRGCVRGVLHSRLGMSSHWTPAFAGVTIVRVFLNFFLRIVLTPTDALGIM
ncbi:MAG TPA: hypothetical protein VGH36_04435, partial [Acetobacteraceae bacterium]